MAISPKVSAATVAASLSTVIIGIVGPHAFPHGTPADIQGLIGAAVTAVVTFASGYLARHDTAAVAEVKADVAKADVVYTKVRQAVQPATVPQAAPLAEAVPLTQA